MVFVFLAAVASVVITPILAVMYLMIRASFSGAKRPAGLLDAMAAVALYGLVFGAIASGNPLLALAGLLLGFAIPAVAIAKFVPAASEERALGLYLLATYLIVAMMVLISLPAPFD